MERLKLVKVCNEKNECFPGESKDDTVEGVFKLAKIIEAYYGIENEDSKNKENNEIKQNMMSVKIFKVIRNIF